MVTSVRIPTSVADQMVSLLFDDSLTLKFDDILYAASESGELVDAVYRYCEQRSLDPPSGVALTRNPETARDLREQYADEDLVVRATNILSEDSELDRSFDFVVGDPPAIEWRELDDERRREYASSLSSVRPDDSDVDSDSLHIERSLQFVKPHGRGVFLTTTNLTVGDTASSARDYLAPLVNDIVRVPTDGTGASDESQVITVLTGEGQGEYQPDARVNKPDPETIESQLVAAANETASRRTAEAIMTPIDELDVVSADRDAASVYFELFYEDYDTTLVYEAPAERDQLRGFVSRAELKVEGGETIEEHTESIPPARCLDPDAGIDTLLPKLGLYRFCFVGTPSEPVGLVTRYDLNKLPIYHQLYDQLARFEIGLRHFIRENAPDWESQTTVTLGVYGSGELVPDRLTTAQLRDLIQIVRDLDLHTELGVNLSEHKASLHDIATLRNAVAHYNPIVHVMGSRPTDDDPERGAPQLATEYHLLTACLEELAEL